MKRFAAAFLALCALGQPAAAQQQDPAMAAYERQDYATAIRLWEQRCTPDDADGCSFLALLYLNGEGVARDPRRAQGLFERGCEGSDVRGENQFNISGCLMAGRLALGEQGGRRDESDARGFFERACTANGNQRQVYDSCFYQARMMREGTGGPRDQARAIIQFSTLCYSDHALSCMATGDMVERGESGAGNPPALTEAIRAYEHACRLGEQAGCTARDRLANYTGARKN